MWTLWMCFIGLCYLFSYPDRPNSWDVITGFYPCIRVPFLLNDIPADPRFHCKQEDRGKSSGNAMWLCVHPCMIEDIGNGVRPVKGRARIEPANSHLIWAWYLLEPKSLARPSPMASLVRPKMLLLLSSK